MPAKLPQLHHQRANLRDVARQHDLVLGVDVGQADAADGGRVRVGARGGAGVGGAGGGVVGGAERGGAEELVDGGDEGAETVRFAD